MIHDSQNSKRPSGAILWRSGRHSKYNAKITEVDGIKFHSKAEAGRWAELSLLQKAGVIRDLKRQVSFPFKLNGELMFTYIADFTYRRHGSGALVVEDVKGVATPLYKLKKKLTEAMHCIVIIEITKGKSRGRTKEANRKR